MLIEGSRYPQFKIVAIKASFARYLKPVVQKCNLKHRYNQNKSRCNCSGKRTDIAKAGIALYKKKQGKK